MIQVTVKINNSNLSFLIPCVYFVYNIIYKYYIKYNDAQPNTPLNL